MIICLDAGHYGKYNRSPGVAAYYESDMNWKLHLLLKKHLEAYGVKVITTRANQAKDLALESRGKIAKGCDLFISIHSNAVGSKMNESVDYPLACCSVSGKADALGQKLAQCVQKAMGTSQAGRITKKKLATGSDYYGVLRGAAKVGVPGVLLEHSFHTNTKAAKWLLIDSNLEKLAKAEAEVIAAHYSLTKQAETAVSGLQATSLKSMSNTDILAKIGGLFTADQKKTGVLASVSLAQFILESGWGGSELAQNANNCFGMKETLSGNTWTGSTWDDSIYTKKTSEFENGAYKTITANFRKYSCIEDSIADHSAYLIGAKNGKNLRYAGLEGETDYRKAITIIKNGGYATSPTYIDRVCAIIEQWGLTKYDVKPAPKPTETAFQPYKVKVICSSLNIRKTPKWGNSDVVGVIKDNGVYTIVDEYMLGSTKFGLLKSAIDSKGVNHRNRWISLGSTYVKKV